MKTPRVPRLVMAPLVCSLSLAAAASALAAPSKKKPAPAPPPPAPVVVETPAPKKPFLQKLNPFRKKEAAPAPVAPVVPATAVKKNSKKSWAPPASVVAPVQPGIRPADAPPVDPSNRRSIVTNKPLPPEPAPAPVPAPAAEKETKKGGFFSRLRAKLDEDKDAVAVLEKPERPLDWKERWVVTDDSTAFYEFGPSQASGPDLRLNRGQVVKLSNASRGWAHVEIEGGRKGYIGTDQMRAAREGDFSEPAFLPSQLASVGAQPQGWSPIAPMPDLPDVPMAPGVDQGLLLLPPLEFEGAELKKSSMILPKDNGPDLKPGDTLPAPSLDLELPVIPAVDPALPAATDEKETPAAPETPAVKEEPLPEAPAVPKP